jgi:hypothetical protein
MRPPATVYEIVRDAQGGVRLVRRSEHHVHTGACLSDQSTPGRPFLKCGNYDAKELARIAGLPKAPAFVRTLVTEAASLRIRNHSPDGFEFGYGGSGPSQLALAILLDATEDADLAERHYQDFKWHAVARWQGDGVEISVEEILRFLGEAEQTDAAFDVPAGKAVTS